MNNQRPDKLITHLSNHQAERTEASFLVPWRIVAALVLTFTFTIAALSHDTWLLPNRTTVPVGASITSDLTSGMAFPLPAYAIKTERIERASMRLGGRLTEITARRAAPKSLRLTTLFDQPGMATLWVELKPKSLTLTPKLVTEYLDEIGASEEIRQIQAQSKPQRWRELYTKHAKTFVQVGHAGQDQSWAEPVGMALEIVPEKDPTSLRAGDDFPVRVLKQGKPLADFPLGLIREQTTKGLIQKTNAEGRTTFKLNRAGRWLLRGTELRRSSSPDTDWESDFTTLTIEVKTLP
jgi:uncharacterized GH25 family protein